MLVSRLDTVYRKILITKFFTKGWGNPENLLKLFAFRKLVSNKETCFHLVSRQYPITILKEEKWSDCRIIDGKFRTPLALHLPDVVPDEVQDAYFQMILPLTWKSSKYKPICIHLAGTGDHFFWRRRNMMVKPLLKAGIGAIILENPFYGLRKPKEQIRSSLHNVSDIFVMGGCLILECLTLLHWCESQGFGPLGLSGLSMGGHMASLAATNWPKPIVLVPCLSWSTASGVFTEGVMSDSIDWKLLQNQYSSNSVFYDRLVNLLTSVEPNILSESTTFCQANVDMTKLSEKHKQKDSLKLEKNNLFENNSNSIKTPEEILKSTINNLKEATQFSSSILHKSDNIRSVLRKPADALHFMRVIMDECTHLKNFSIPHDTSLITAVCAQADGYVPRNGCSSLEDIWPGVTIKYLNAGHVSAYIWYQKFFRHCITEAFEKAKRLSS